MSSPPKHIEALVASRICHDLAGSIGAIMNGFELAQLSDDLKTDSMEFELIGDSISQLNARLQLCRIAFGPSSSGQTVKGSALINALNAASHAGTSIQFEPPAEMTRIQGKLLCLAAMCLLTALPRGGDITINLVDGGFKLTATGSELSIPAAWKHPGTSLSSENLSKVEFELLDTYLSVSESEREIHSSDEFLSLFISTPKQ